MERAFFFDIDGTLADPSHRLHHIQKRPKDWDSFFAAVADDIPIEHMRDLCRFLQLTIVGTKVVFLSGRPERTRFDTQRWLADHQCMLTNRPIYMRADPACRT